MIWIPKQVFLLNLCICIGLALSCGGGGGDVSSSSKDNKIEVELTHEASGLSKPSRNKFAFFEGDEPFVIYSDQNRDDSEDADQIKAIFSRIIDGEEVKVREKIQFLEREPSAPYDVIASSRRLTFEGLPDARDYILTISLGRNYISEFPDDPVVTYYQGRIENLTIFGTSILRNGERSNKITVPMGNHYDEKDDKHVVNGFIDYSSVPSERLSSEFSEPFENYGKVAVTNFFPIDDPEFRVFQSRNLKRGGTRDFQSQAFQIVEAPSEILAYTIQVNSGEPDGMVLSGFVTKEEIATRKSILVDFDTTYALGLTLWYPLATSTGELSATEQSKLYARMYKVVEYLNAIIAEVDVESSVPIKVHPAELALLGGKYESMVLSETGDEVGTLTNGPKFFATVLGFFITINYIQELGYWFFPENKSEHRSIEVLLPNESNKIITKDNLNELADVVRVYYLPHIIRARIDIIAPPDE